MQAAERHNFLSEIFYRAAHEIYRVIYDKEAVVHIGAMLYIYSGILGVMAA